MTTTIKKILDKSSKYQVYQALGKVQKQIISTRQNIDAIGKSLMLIEKEGNAGRKLAKQQEQC
jgi:hypothetical protein